MAKSREKQTLGQYFTPAAIAKLMISMSSSKRDARVLEPSSGQGVFLDELLSAGFSHIEGVEVDPHLAQHPKINVRCESFLAYQPSEPFDLVIGNPPYIRWKDLSEDGRNEMRSHRLYGELFNSLSDYLTAFIAGSVEVLKDGGELIFVTPSFWMHTLHSSPLREWLLRHGAVTDVVDFGEASVFKGVASAIVVFRFQKGGHQQKSVKHHLYIGPRSVPQSDLTLEDPSLFSTRILRPFSPGEHWTLATAEELVQVEALEESCRKSATTLFGGCGHYRFGEFVKIANGMVSGLDRAFQLPPEVVERLTLDEAEATIRVTKARQLTPMVCSETTRYVDIPVGLSEDEAHARYPNLMKHLAEYREELEGRYDYGRHLPYWEWAFRRSAAFLLDGRAKGLIPCKERLTSRPKIRVALSRPGVAAVQDMTAFSPLPQTRESIEYMVAYLNHPWVTEWVTRRGLVKGGVAEFSEKPLSEIPFRPIDWDNPAEVEAHARIVRIMEAMWETDTERDELGMRAIEVVDDLIRGSGVS